MKTIKWDKFIGMVNDNNLMVLVDGVEPIINYLPSKDMLDITYKNMGEVYQFDIKRVDNEEIEVGTKRLNVVAIDEDGMKEVCFFQFLKPVTF